MGTTHVLSGFAVGIATAPLAGLETVAAQITWVAVTAGASLAPDLDSTQGSAGRMWGPISAALASGISAICRGHRGRSHDVILAPIVSATLIMILSTTAIGSALVATLTTGLVLAGLRISGLHRATTGANIILSAAAGYASYHFGITSHTAAFAVPFALGMVTHIAGDWLTGGVPVPLTHLWGKFHRTRFSLFRTGDAIERYVVTPALTLAVIAGFARAVPHEIWAAL